MRVLHVLDHSIPLHSGYTFRTRSILREQRALGWETFHVTGSKQNSGDMREETVDGLHFYRTPVVASALARLPVLNQKQVIDGLVRRDLRRWTGARESSFLYHHAKRYTHWALTGGFGLYLSWPFGGFNPAYMVLVFTFLVAIALSTTVAAFKKYA